MNFESWLYGKSTHKRASEAAKTLVKNGWTVSQRFGNIYLVHRTTDGVLVHAHEGRKQVVDWLANCRDYPTC